MYFIDNGDHDILLLLQESTKKTKTKQEVKEKQKAATKSADQPEKKRERKVYDLPGQKRDPPAEVKAL